jgi:hypothetical protein
VGPWQPRGRRPRRASPPAPVNAGVSPPRDRETGPVHGLADSVRFSHQDLPSADAWRRHRCRSGPCASECQSPTGGSLCAGAGTQVPDDLLQPRPGAPTAPFNWERIPGEKTSVRGRGLHLMPAGRGWAVADQLTGHPAQAGHRQLDGCKPGVPPHVQRWLTDGIRSRGRLTASCRARSTGQDPHDRADGATS